MSNRQIHSDTEIPLLQDWRKTQLKNVLTNLKTSDGTHFYSLGAKTKYRPLKPLLPQDLLVSDVCEDKDQT